MWGLGALPALLLASLLPAATLGAPNCPIQGPAFEKPRNPSADPGVKAAVANLTAFFDGMANAGGVPANNVSWSIEIWSANEKDLVFSHYHTQKNLEQTNHTGVSKVDTDTVFRLGSLTKVFSVMNWLANDGDVKWNTPITEFVPELKEIQASRPNDPVRRVDWDAVTIGALLSQMSGLPRDCE
jgi:CubicO group peptidase (beta-lactamase class C family)